MWLIISSVIIGSALVIFAGVAVKNKAAEYDLPFLLSPSGYLVLVGTVVFWAGFLCCYNGPEGQLTDFLMLSAISCIIWLAGMVINKKEFISGWNSPDHVSDFDIWPRRFYPYCPAGLPSGEGGPEEDWLKPLANNENDFQI